VSKLYLADRTDMFKMGNLVEGGKWVITWIYSNLVGTEREFSRV